jgi:hypothetical protein
MDFYLFEITFTEVNKMTEEFINQANAETRFYARQETSKFREKAMLELYKAHYTAKETAAILCLTYGVVSARYQVFKEKGKPKDFKTRKEYNEYIAHQKYNRLILLVKPLETDDGMHDKIAGIMDIHKLNVLSPAEEPLELQEIKADPNKLKNHINHMFYKQNFTVPDIASELFMSYKAVRELIDFKD